MKQLARALGWFLIAVATIVGGLLLYSFFHALVTPDPTGSPDVRGMATSLSLLVFVVVALPALGIGWLLCGLAELGNSCRPNNSFKPSPLPANAWQVQLAMCLLPLRGSA